jgi:hypothetical protein
MWQWASQCLTTTGRCAIGAPNTQGDGTYDVMYINGNAVAMPIINNNTRRDAQLVDASAIMQTARQGNEVALTAVHAARLRVG